MVVRKICKPKGCRGSPRCEHPWWFDLMHGGRRWRMRVDDFAVARGATETVMSKQTAERVWEPRFLAEIMAGRDPRVAPATQPAAAELTVSGFLDRYYTSYVEAEGLRSRITIRGRLNAAKVVLGELPIVALEKPETIQRFKAAFRQGHEIATVNRALGTLRAAINWGRFQDPPLLANSPFHRFGVTIRAKEETHRDRRLGPDEEKGAPHGSSRHEQCRTSMRRRGDARPHHRGPRDVLPAGRDAAHPEPPRGLGAPPGGHPGRPHERLREPSDAVRPSGPARTDPEAAREARPERVRLRRRKASSRTASRPRGVAAVSSQTGTTPHARSRARASTARSCAPSTCTGTTCGTRGRAGCSPKAWTSASFS